MSQLRGVLCFLIVAICHHTMALNKTVEEKIVWRAEIVPGYGVHPVTPQLRSLVERDRSTWHWLPWHHVRADFYGTHYDVQICAESDADFPEDLFTEDQLRHGAIILHMIATIYGFSLLAVICDDYFIPAVECICEDLNISKDIAAATFMATATSTPELFVNVMGTFVTESDLGIGTIIGSAMFNMLGVAGIGSLAAIKPIPIKRWPVTRDSCIYAFVICALVVIVWDDRIEWWETIIFLCFYVLYFIIIFNSNKIKNVFNKLCNCCVFTLDDDQILFPSENAGIDNPAMAITEKPTATENDATIEAQTVVTEHFDKALEAEPDRAVQEGEVSVEAEDSLWRFPSEKTPSAKLWFLYKWPIKFILTITVPSPLTFRFLYPLTFILCIVWIGINSYFVSWMITTIGSTFTIPDSIMGITFLAFGGCLPEAFSLYLLTRRGEGGIGVSNSLGANSLAILFSLGIPWFIKSMALKGKGEEGFIDIDSAGMNYIIPSLLLVLLSMYLVLYFNKFYLRKFTGFVLFGFYIFFLIMAILVESNVFFETRLSFC